MPHTLEVNEPTLVAAVNLANKNMMRGRKKYEVDYVHVTAGTSLPGVLNR